MGRVFFPTYRSNILGVRDTTRDSLLAGLGLDIPRAPAEPYPRAVNNPTGPMLGALAEDGLGMAIVEANGRYPYPITAPIVNRGPVYQIPGTGQNVSPMPTPIAAPVILPTPIIYSPGSPAAPVTTPAPPVSAQSSPTPTVSVPQAPASGAILVTSGGGTATVATAPPTPTVYSTDANGNIINAATGQIVLSAGQAASMGVSASSLTASGGSAGGSTIVTSSSSLTDQVAAWLSGSTPLLGYNIPNALLAAGVLLAGAALMGGKKR